VPFSRLAIAIWKRSLTEAKETLKGFVRLWGSMPVMLFFANKGKTK